MLDLYAYTDETGNTGMNLFDENQPYFLTGTILANKDLDRDTQFNDDIHKVLDLLGVSELHAAELGYGRLNQVANQLMSIIEGNDLKFFFTRVEKRHIASLKIFDYIYDGYNNPAASKFHYTVRPLRLPLAYEFIQRVRPMYQEKFWHAYKKRDTPKILEVLRKIRIEIINKTLDRRISELLLDGIEWAQNNPNEVFTVKRSLLDSPNIVAFGLLLNNLHLRYIDTPFRIQKFVHDEQNEFAKDIRFIFSSLKNLSFDMSTFSTMFDMDEVNTFLTEDVIIGSSSKLGSLQIVDIALWMIKKKFEIDSIDPTTSPDLAALENCIISRSDVTVFSKQQLMEDVMASNYKVSQLPLDINDINRGKLIFDEIEKQRKNGMLLDKN